MKSGPVNLCLLLAVVCSCYLYTLKFSQPGGQDKLIAGLAGVHQYLPPGTSIHFVNKVPPEPTNSREHIFFPDFVHYILAPAKIGQASKTWKDTTLMVLPANSTDSATAALVAGATVLWQNKDERYLYLLIH
jgi:hypothetical protein